MALGTILSGRNGLVKVGAAESDNVEGFSIQRSTSTEDIAFLNTSNDVSVSGSVVWSGTIDIVFDPADATHITMQSGGSGTLELYLDGSAVDDWYFTATVLFDGFDLSNAASSGKLTTSVNFKATGAVTFVQVV